MGRDKIDRYINKIIQGDCIKIMKELSDKSVDLILTDLPYGVKVKYEGYDDTEENLINLINRFMPEALRVSKRVVLTCGHTNIWKYPKSDWIMAWVIPAGNNRNSWGFTCWQPILCYGKNPYLQNRKGARRDIIISNEKSENFGHPCSKPLNLWKKLLLKCSIVESDIILDPFAGSGTTLVACKQLNRKYIGIEKEPKYVEICKQRLRQRTIWEEIK